MVKICELLKLESLENFRLIAGENGLNKAVNSVGILEYETCENLHDLTFEKGDFVLTTLFFAKNNKELAEDSIKRLIDKRISGLAIKNIYYDSFSETVINYANNNAVPIFVFNETYFEDIIMSITDTLRSNKDYGLYEEKVNSIINQEVGKTVVRKVAKEINSNFYNNIIVAYCVEKNYKNDVNIIKILERLMFRKNRNTIKMSSSIFKYKKGILVIYSFDIEDKYANEELAKIIKMIQIKEDEFYIGISDIHCNLDELDICIKKSIYAFISCRNKNILRQNYKDIGLDKLLIPLNNNYWVNEFCKNIIEPIVNYDNKYNSNLMLTAISYIKNNCKISSTAEELFQHKNTIRYRLEKIQQITGISKNDQDFEEQLLYAIRFYLTMNKI